MSQPDGVMIVYLSETISSAEIAVNFGNLIDRDFV